MPLSQELPLSRRRAKLLRAGEIQIGINTPPLGAEYLFLDNTSFSDKDQVKSPIILIINQRDLKFGTRTLWALLASQLIQV